MSLIIDWVRQYYINPIIFDTSYNPVDTLTWAIVLGLAVFVLVKLFEMFQIKMDERLIIYTVPYIFAGSTLRVIEDAELVKPPLSYLLITPLIFFLVFLVTASSLLICKRFTGKNFYRIYSTVGILWTVINLAVLSIHGFENPWVLIAVFLLGSSITLAIWLLHLGLPFLRFLDDRFNLMILYVQMLDASSTYIGVDWFSYYEKHVVPTYLISIVGSAVVMYPLKLLVILPVLYMIDKYMEDSSLRNLIKLTLITLGLAPAVRNTLRLAIGV